MNSPVEYIVSEPVNWFFDSIDRFDKPQRVTTELQYLYTGQIDADAFLASIVQVFETYPNLNCKYVTNGHGVSQIQTSLKKDTLLSVVDLSHEPNSSLPRIMGEHCNEIRSHFNFEEGKLAKFILFKTSESTGYIWTCFQFVVADMVTSRIIFSDILRNYRCVLSGKPFLKKRVDDYNAWMAKFNDFRSSLDNPDFRQFWNSRPWDQVKRLPTDYPEKFQTQEDLTHAYNNRTPEDFTLITQELSVEASKGFLDAHGKALPGASCAAFTYAIGKTFVHPWLLVNLFNSVHDLTEYGPLAPPKTMTVLGRHAEVGIQVLNTQASLPIQEALHSLILQMKETPYNGMGFYDLRKQTNAEALSHFNTAIQAHGFEFNFLGTFSKVKQETFECDYIYKSPMDYDSYSLRSQRGVTDQLLRVRFYISNGKINFDILYFNPYFLPETINTLRNQVIAVISDYSKQS